jgi:alanine racemase
MDQFMVDFGDTEPIEGEDVLLMGKWEEDEITIETIAKSIDSTPYVLSTAIGGRTERIYQD